MRHVNEIIVHCAATRPNWMADRPTRKKVAEVRRWHVDENGWSDIGYHLIIDRDGTVAVGRPIERPGAHVRGHNTNSIAIMLFGGHGSSAADSFEQHYTPEQDKALREEIARLKEEHPAITKISGHNEYDNKACPGFNVTRWHKRKVRRKTLAESSTVQASVASIGGAAGTAASAIAAFDDVAQYMILGFAGVIALAALWIMRERIKRWARGDR